MDEKEAFERWFAGFVAGEGCFVIQRGHSRGDVFACYLTIRLRDDDLPILLEAQEVLAMGTIIRHTNERRRSRPAAVFSITAIDDLLRLVDLFDAYPLRAKKQRDYEIWRKAVLEISKGRGINPRQPATYDRQYLEYLATKLKMIRAYDTPGIEDFEPNNEQLELPFPARRG